MSPDQKKCLLALYDLHLENGWKDYYHFAPIEADTTLPRNVVRRCMRAFKSAGLAEFSHGLTRMDGKLAGSGYRLTDAGFALVEKEMRS